MTRSMDEPSDVKALLAMTMLGLGGIIGGYIIGGVRDKLGNRIAIFSEIVLMLAAVALVMVYNYKDNFTYLSAYSMCLLWGI